MKRLGSGLSAVVSTIYTPSIFIISFLLYQETVGSQASFGGLLVVVGIILSSIKIPKNVTLYDDPPTVVNVPIKSGDAIIFTPLLRHGTRKWTEDFSQYTVFMRFVYAKQFILNDSKRLLNHEKYKGNISKELY